jgi:hypothetical protein
MATLLSRPRPATAAAVDEIAKMFSTSFRLPRFWPMLHSVAQDHSFIANVILRDCEVTVAKVAKDDSGIVSFRRR